MFGLASQEVGLKSVSSQKKPGHTQYKLQTLLSDKSEPAPVLSKVFDAST